ncbi:MAG: tetratricopeptide repeat protein [Planctomycetota bacterium]
MPTTTPHRLRRWTAAIAVIVGVVVGVYWRSFGVPFLFDDHSAILDNPAVRQLWPLLTPAADLPVSGRPLVSLSLALNYALSGYEVFGYHVVNLGCHAASACLVFAIAARTMCAAGRQPAASQTTALVIALLWATHPLISEAVVYVVQRTELMVSFFMLAALYAALRAFGAGASRWWTSTAVVAGMAATQCKEIAVATPILILAYDRAFAAGSFAGAWRHHRLLHVGMFLTWLPLAAGILAGPRGDSVGFDHGVTATEYLQTQAGVVMWYLKSCVAPTDLAISHFWPITTHLADAALPGLALMAATAAAAMAWWRWPKIGFLALWFFAILAPTSSVVPIPAEVAAERRMYLPLLAIVALAVLAIEHAGQRLIQAAGQGRAWLRLGGAIAAVTTIALFAQMTRDRVEIYGDEITVWRDAADKQQDNAVAHTNLGLAYERSGDLLAAIAHYHRSIAIREDHAVAHLNLGGALARHGDLDAAARSLNRARELDPHHPAPWINLGNIAIMRGAWVEATRLYQRALELAPTRVKAHVNLALAFEQLRRFDEARRHLQRAVALDPTHTQARTAYDSFLARRHGRPQ